MKKKLKSILPLCIFGLSGFIQSCDPTYSVRIENISDKTAIVTAHTTIHFQAQEIEITDLGGTYDSAIVRFAIPSGKYVDCGMAIAELDNEVPFTKLHIKAGENSLVALTEAEVLGLFEKNVFGKLKTPYRIVIE